MISIFLSVYSGLADKKRSAFYPNSCVAGFRTSKACFVVIYKALSGAVFLPHLLSDS